MLNYLNGDVTKPVLGGPNRTIAHVVNDMGGWGKGVSGDIGHAYPKARKEYKKWHHRQIQGRDFELGCNQIVDINRHLWVVNMLCQRGYIGPRNLVPFQHSDFKDCITVVVAHAVVFESSIHMPRVGCGLGGADWEDVEPIIEEALDLYQDPPEVYIYDL